MGLETHPYPPIVLRLLLPPCRLRPTLHQASQWLRSGYRQAQNLGHEANAILHSETGDDDL